MAVFVLLLNLAGCGYFIFIIQHIGYRTYGNNDDFYLAIFFLIVTLINSAAVYRYVSMTKWKLNIAPVRLVKLWFEAKEIELRRRIASQ